MVVNYRNEPLALRVRDPNTNTQAAGLGGDLAFAFSSTVHRADPNFNVQPTFYPPLTGGVQAGDPFTPLLRAYEDDRVQVRILVGGHEEGHNFAINGVKWLFEPSAANSGYRNSQMMGISEHYEFIIPSLPKNSVGNAADYLYTAGRATDDLWNGLWGIMRGYKNTRQDLLRLPSNANGKLITNTGDFDGVCPKNANDRVFAISAVRAKDVLAQRLRGVHRHRAAHVVEQDRRIRVHAARREHALVGLERADAAHHGPEHRPAGGGDAVAGGALRLEHRLARRDRARARGQAAAVGATHVDVPGRDLGLGDRTAARLGRRGGRTGGEAVGGAAGQCAGGEQGDEPATLRRSHCAPPRRRRWSKERCRCGAARSR
jgi:hypothetical protein